MLTLFSGDIMKLDLSLQLFIKIFGNIIPNDKNFNIMTFIKEFETYFIAPLSGSLCIVDSKHVNQMFTRYKKVFKFLSCTIEHDEFHKVYNCVFTFNKYRKTYQQLELNMRYDKSYISTFYYHQKMERHLQYGGRVSLTHQYMRDRDYCYVVQEYDIDNAYYTEPKSRYFMFDDIFYESTNHEDFNGSSLLTFTHYDQSLNVKNLDYFCVGEYNFNISFANGLYSAKRYTFVGSRENITDKVVGYLNDGGFRLTQLSKEDLLMSEAYHC